MHERLACDAGQSTHKPIGASQTSKVFRVFVSSTFTDLIEERNALQKYVFPTLHGLCTRYGCRFQAIDLRWGISEEASLDQQTMRVCLEEIARCQKVTPRPNFIVLLGDRYGWQPLPYEIPADEYAQIDRRILAEKDKALLSAWYERDDNAVPSVYYLKPREKPGPFEDYQTWEREVERPLRNALVTASAQAALAEEQRLKYGSSATEQEIIAGALNPSLADVGQHVFGFFRTIERLPHDRVATDFIDLDENGLVDSDAHQRLVRLKHRLEEVLPGQVETYTAEWTTEARPIEAIHTVTGSVLDALSQQLSVLLKERTLGQLGDDDWRGLDLVEEDALERHRSNAAALEAMDHPTIAYTHIPKLCADVFLSLGRIILGQIAEIIIEDPLKTEIAQHEAFARDRTRVFIGRSEPMHAIREYLQDAGGSPFIITGASGSGKSSLMAEVVRLARQSCREGCHIAVRFIGATTASSDIRQLLRGLCQELYDAFGFEQEKERRIAAVTGMHEEAHRHRQSIEAEYSIPDETFKLSETLARFLKNVPEGRSLIVFLDALDQFSAADTAGGLSWLPAEVPANVHIIISTLPDDSLAVVTRTLPAALPLELGPMTKEEGEEILSHLLNGAKRTLRADQRDEVLLRFAACGLPLYLQMAFEEVRSWRSVSPNAVLPDTVPGIIGTLFERLSRPANHGTVLVSRTLGYLAAAKNGLTEDEMLEVLSRDEELWRDFAQHAHHTPAEQRLPIVLWSRLYLDLEPYLIERNADGTSLLSFFHRQVGQAATDQFLSGDNRVLHERLARYFDDLPRVPDASGKVVPPLRALSELPYQLVKSEQPGRLATFIRSNFLETKAQVLGDAEALDDARDIAFSLSDAGGQYWSELLACAHLHCTLLERIQSSPNALEHILRRGDLVRVDQIIASEPDDVRRGALMLAVSALLAEASQHQIAARYSALATTTLIALEKAERGPLVTLVRSLLERADSVEGGGMHHREPDSRHSQLPDRPESASRQWVPALDALLFNPVLDVNDCSGLPMWRFFAAFVCAGTGYLGAFLYFESSDRFFLAYGVGLVLAGLLMFAPFLCAAACARLLKRQRVRHQRQLDCMASAYRNAEPTRARKILMRCLRFAPFCNEPVLSAMLACHLGRAGAEDDTEFLELATASGSQAVRTIIDHLERLDPATVSQLLRRVLTDWRGFGSKWQLLNAAVAMAHRAPVQDVVAVLTDLSNVPAPKEYYRGSLGVARSPEERALLDVLARAESGFLARSIIATVTAPPSGKWSRLLPRVGDFESIPRLRLILRHPVSWIELLMWPVLASYILGGISFLLYFVYFLGLFDLVLHMPGRTHDVYRLADGRSNEWSLERLRQKADARDGRIKPTTRWLSVSPELAYLRRSLLALLIVRSDAPLHTHVALSSMGEIRSVLRRLAKLGFVTDRGKLVLLAMINRSLLAEAEHVGRGLGIGKRYQSVMVPQAEAAQISRSLPLPRLLNFCSVAILGIAVTGLWCTFLQYIVAPRSIAEVTIGGPPACLMMSLFFAVAQHWPESRGLEAGAGKGCMSICIGGLLAFVAFGLLALTKVIDASSYRPTPSMGLVTLLAPMMLTCGVVPELIAGLRGAWWLFPTRWELWWGRVAAVFGGLLACLVLAYVTWWVQPILVRLDTIIK